MLRKLLHILFPNKFSYPDDSRMHEILPGKWVIRRQALAKRKRFIVAGMIFTKDTVDPAWGSLPEKWAWNREQSPSEEENEWYQPGTYTYSDGVLAFSKNRDGSVSHAGAITVLSRNHFMFSISGEIYSMRRLEEITQPDPKNSYDQIMISGSAGLNPVQWNYSLRRDGVFYRLKENVSDQQGFFKGTASETDTKSIFEYYESVGVLNLQNVYTEDIHDAVCVDTYFFRNGKLVKHIHDYSGSSPLSFQWADTYIARLNNACDLSPVAGYEEIREAFSGAAITRACTQRDVNQDAAFQFSVFILHATACKTEFEEKYRVFFGNFRFRAQSGKSFEIADPRYITSDGRYFRFYGFGPEPFTLDFGFDFVLQCLPGFKSIRVHSAVVYRQRVAMRLPFNGVIKLPSWYGNEPSY